MTRLKQEILHSAAAISRPVALCAGLCLSGLPAGDLRAQVPMPMLGSADGASTLRLVAEPGPASGRYLAGVELVMLPGSHTYWQIPGEAGVPPVFTFNGSKNVRAATVKFPVPQRITEQGLEAYGYGDRVVFPVDVVPDDPAKPALLHVDASYAVCNKLCLPGHGEASIELRPGGTGASPGLAARAFAEVPRALPDLPALKEDAQPGRTQASWILTWNGPTPPPRDIFPVAPEGYVFATKKTAPKAWVLTAESTVTSSTSLSVPVTLVLRNEGAPTEVTRTFQLKPPAAP